MRPSAQALAAQLDAAERRAPQHRGEDAGGGAGGGAGAARAGARGARSARGVCLFDETWHQGVVGLVASRVKERLRRPVIAFALADEATLRGSARSVPGRPHPRRARCHRRARSGAASARFGGHAMAAGLTLERAQLDALRARVRCGSGARAGAAQAARRDRDRRRARPRRRSRCETAQALRAGGPWGQAFPEPSFDGLFSIRSARVHRRAAPEDVGRGAQERARRSMPSPSTTSTAGPRVRAAVRAGAPRLPPGGQRVPGRAAPAAARRSRAAGG